MKNLIIMIILSAFIWSCSASTKKLPENQKPSIATQKKTDSADEWEITVFDAEYENFVATRAQPKSIHRIQPQIQKYYFGQRMEFQILFRCQSKFL